MADFVELKNYQLRSYQDKLFVLMSTEHNLIKWQNGDISTERTDMLLHNTKLIKQYDTCAAAVCSRKFNYDKVNNPDDYRRYYEKRQKELKET